MAVSAQQKRIARLHAAYSVCLIEYERQMRWNQPDRAEGFRTAVKLLDACIIAEMGDDRDEAAEDQRMVARLRDIARDRDLLRLDAPAATEAEVPAA